MALSTTSWTLSSLNLATIEYIGIRPAAQGGAMADVFTHSDQKLEEFRNCLAFEQLKAIELIQEVKRDPLEDKELESIVNWTFQRSKTHHGATASILNIVWKNTLKASIALEQGLPDQFFWAINGIISGPQNRQETARQLRIWLSYAFGQVENYLRWQKNDPKACVKLVEAARGHFSVALSIAKGVVESLDKKHPSFSIFQELVEDCQMMLCVLEAETYTKRLPYLLIPSHSHRSFNSRDITAFSNCRNEVFSDIALLIRLWDDYLSQAEKVRPDAIKAQSLAYIDTLRELEQQIKLTVNTLDPLQINAITQKSHEAFKEIIAETQKVKEPDQFHDALAFNAMVRNSHVWLHIDVGNLKKGMISKQELNLYKAAVQEKLVGYPVKSSYFSPIDCLLADLELKRYQLTVILPGGYCYHVLQNLTNETLIFARDLERLHLQSRQGLSMEKCLDVFFDDLALRKNTIETLLSRLEILRTKLAEINITLPEATINSFEDVSKLEGSQVFFENISPVLPDLLAFAKEYGIASAYGDDTNALVGAIVRAVLSKNLIDEYFSEYSQLTEALIYDLFSSDPITTMLRLQKESLALDRVFSLFQPLGNVHIDLFERDILALDKMRSNYYQSLKFLTGLGGSWNDDVHLGEKNFSDPRSKQKFVAYRSEVIDVVDAVCAARKELADRLKEPLKKTRDVFKLAQFIAEKIEVIERVIATSRVLDKLEEWQAELRHVNGPLEAMDQSTAAFSIAYLQDYLHQNSSKVLQILRTQFRPFLKIAQDQRLIGKDKVKSKTLKIRNRPVAPAADSLLSRQMSGLLTALELKIASLDACISGPQSETKVRCDEELKNTKAHLNYHCGVIKSCWDNSAQWAQRRSQESAALMVEAVLCHKLALQAPSDLALLYSHDLISIADKLSMPLCADDVAWLYEISEQIKDMSRFEKPVLELTLEATQAEVKRGLELAVKFLGIRANQVPSKGLESRMEIPETLDLDLLDLPEKQKMLANQICEPIPTSQKEKHYEYRRLTMARALLKMENGLTAYLHVARHPLAQTNGYVQMQGKVAALGQLLTAPLLFAMSYLPIHCKGNHIAHVKLSSGRLLRNSHDPKFIFAQIREFLKWHPGYPKLDLEDSEMKILALFSHAADGINRYLAKYEGNGLGLQLKNLRQAPDDQASQIRFQLGTKVLDNYMASAFKLAEKLTSWALLLTRKE